MPWNSYAKQRWQDILMLSVFSTQLHKGVSYPKRSEMMFMRSNDIQDDGHSDSTTPSAARSAWETSTNPAQRQIVQIVLICCLARA